MSAAPGASWGEFEAAEPAMAEWGRKLLYRDGVGDVDVHDGGG